MNSNVLEDFELLRTYAENGAEDAFTALVNRYINLVYSAALRQGVDAHTAAEITQSVFIILARKAQSMRPGTILAGWLLRTAHYTAANARRRERHRHETEQQFMDHLYTDETEAAWKQIAPLLDEALATLRERDRDAVALRYFEQRSYKEIGAALSWSEDNARKRVARAIERLRSLLGKRGCTLTAAVLTTAISAQATKAAPAGLVSAVVETATVKALVAAGALPPLVQGTLQTLIWGQWRSLGVRGIAAAFILGLGLILVRHFAVDGTAQPIRAAGSASATIIRTAAATPKVSENGSRSNSALSPANSGNLLFRVVEAGSLAPVARARLTLTWTTDFPERQTNTFATDDKGECLVPLDLTPVKNWSSRIEVFKNGYVPIYVSWSASQGDAIDALPAEYTAKLTHGTEIGGSVVDEQGEPVPEVRVVFTVNGPSPGASHDRERLTLMGHYHAEVTDLQGRWRCDHVPEQFGMIIYECLHPLYVTAQFGSTSLGTASTLGMEYVAESELRNGSLKTVLKPGLIVAGVVVDGEGRPISHAKVTVNRAWNELSASEETGTGGRFRFANSAQKELVLTVQSTEFAPMEVTVQPGNQTDALSLKLSKGGELRARVLDDFAQPIANARIRLNNVASGGPRFEWTAKTDGQGRLEWLHAPATEVAYNVGAAGFEGQSNLKLDADGSEQVITLHRSSGQSRAIRIVGTAVDADTGKPLESFRVVTTIAEGERSPAGMKMTSISSPEIQAVGTAGKFSFNARESALSYALEVQATGYTPARSELDGLITNDTRVAFELKRSAPVTGIVRLPDGGLAEGADVMLSALETRQDSKFPARMETVYMKLPGEFDLVRSQGGRTSTDARGRFTLEPRLAMKRILIAHRSGYAEVSVDPLPPALEVVLQPWGRVEGTLRIGSRLGTNEILNLRNWGWAHIFSPSLQINLQAKSDSEGRFSIEGVPPGEWQISHEVRLLGDASGEVERKPVKIKVGSGYSMILPLQSGASLGTLIRVEAGQTAQVKLGGTGRRVIGRVKSTGITQVIDWQRDLHRLTAKAYHSPVGAIPKRAAFATEHEYGAALQEQYARLREFWLSATGAEAKRLPGEYVVVFSPDGTFHIDDVVPGIYELDVSVSDPTIPDSFIGGKSIGALAKEITVPEATDTTGAQALDLGVLELSARNR
jgi:RNA polymerase sigma factor (sigma-70 family)